MGLRTRKYNNARKPRGLLGRKVLNRMNTGTHERLALWSLTHFTPKGDVLDIGCGGGANIAKMLSINDVDKVTGIDYSDVSVSKSKGYNRDAISEGRCNVIKGDVKELPFSDRSFDTVTAFETVYFWPDIGDCFRGVFRILKDGGMFAIVNESDGEDEASIGYSQIIEGMNLYTPERLSQLMEEAGFSDVCIYRNDSKPWICVTGIRNAEP